MVINKFLDDGKITQNEYDIIFSEKKDWFNLNKEGKHDWSKSKDKQKVFRTTFQKVITLLDELETNDLNFKYINFPPIDFNTFDINWEKNIFFNASNFLGETNFRSISFKSSTSFLKCIFHDKVYFINFKFKSHTYFAGSIFYKYVTFERGIFEHEVRFMHSTFHAQVSFLAINFNEYADFRKMSFKQIKLANIKFENSDLLMLSGYENNKRVPLNKIHFANKESAKILKAHFENQNNITESNKYFSLEQELNIEYLKKTKTELNIIPILITLYLNKWVSNFGTDWIRSLLFLFTLSYLFMRFYIDLDIYLPTKDEHIKHFTQVSDIRYIWTMLVSWGLIYLSTFFKSNKFILWSLVSLGIVTGIIGLNNYDSVLAMQNYIIQLTNPINAFKNMNLYDGIEIFGAFVRIVVLTIIYQFIVAFRQNTRRK